MIEAVILDWAGTTVDYGCFAPVQAFIDAFAYFGVDVTVEQTRKPMGMLKKDHIRTMLDMEDISKKWLQKTGHTADSDAVEAVYAQFEPKLFPILESFASPNPFVTDTVAALRAQGIKIGSTTGYTDSMMEIVTKKARQNGYAPDFWFSADSVGGKGRPYPYMIFENLKAMNVTAVKNAVKVGDTVSDIKEGINAGVWSVGVIEGSSELGLSYDAYNTLSAEKKTELCKKTKEIFLNAGANFVIRNLSELQTLINEINTRR